MKAYRGMSSKIEDRVETTVSSPIPYLRVATAEAHRELETSLNLLRVDFTINDYIVILQRFYGFWRPWEQLTELALGDEFSSFFDERKRSARILDDLKQLGSHDCTPFDIPVATKLPELRSTDEALGSMYVMEGSTLGGQLLSRHLTEQLGLRPEQCSFFRGYGHQTMQMWKRFESELSTRPPSSYSEMSMAASETFRCLQNWLCL